MLKLNKEKRIANKIKKLLNKRGFLVQMQISKNTKSVYLKIDNGACNGIRISDHKNNKTNYKFNMIKNYNGKRNEYHNGKIKSYYNFSAIGRLISDIELERSDRVIKYGYSNYKKIRNKEYKQPLYIYNKQVA